MIHGHHVYNDVWTPLFVWNKKLTMQKVVAIVKAETIIGHIPHKVLDLVTLFNTMEQ